MLSIEFCVENNRRPGEIKWRREENCVEIGGIKLLQKKLKLALISSAGCGRSVSIVRLRIKTTEFFFSCGNGIEIYDSSTTFTLDYFCRC
jgi:hypothetical protein